MVKNVTLKKLKNAIDNNYLVSVQVALNKFNDILDTAVSGNVSLEDKSLHIPIQVTPVHPTHEVTTELLAAIIEESGFGHRDAVLNDNDRGQMYMDVVLDNPTIEFDEYNGLKTFYIKLPISGDDYSDTLSIMLTYSDERVMSALDVHTGKKLRGEVLDKVIADLFLGRYGSLIVSVAANTRSTRSFIYPDRFSNGLLSNEEGLVLFAGMSSISVNTKEFTGEVLAGAHYRLVLTGKGKEPDVITFYM